MSQYWPAALFLLQGLMAWFIWSMRQSFATKEDLGKIDDHLGAADRAIAVLEEIVRSSPSQRELGSLREQVGDVSGDVKAVRAELSGLRETQAAQSASLRRVEDFLLKMGDRK